MFRRVPKSSLPNRKPPVDEVEEMVELLNEEATAFSKEFDPVAPWDREDIPDFGPLHDRHHVLIFGIVGVLCTIFYETTDYFDQIHRWLAYLAIWFPLWFRLLGRVSPALTDDEFDIRERREFERELKQIISAKNETDD
ncbi:hypothetical protein CCR75_003994 [Bremia lactucae]|uniref:Uncharacterized protein n=1 Tax=Bremia lactucae TaxID=4779 RepID=A0A976FPD7_BRELC|nr:hypothetical protein CCR75_003994 [Bremia lactucae]